MNLLFSRITVLLLAALALPALAQAPAPAAADTVLISNSLASITRTEYDAELLKLRVDLRAGFANSPRRVNDLLLRMLVQKSMAAQARADNLDAKPENAVRIQLEVDRFLAQLLVDGIEARASAEFDANNARFEARAREIYAVDRSKFAMPEQVSATHILFDTKKHSSDEAKKLAQDARAKVAAGADMGKLAQEVSEDPSAAQNSGALGWFEKKSMDPAFADAAFALKKPGDLSEPVLSQFGWHVIRLDARRPAYIQSYEQARDGIMAELKKGYVNEKREEAIAAIRRDPKTQVNREAVDALTPQVDVEAARRALGMSPGGAPPAGAAPR